MIMSTVHLPEELAERLAVEAARRGISVDDLATEALLAHYPQKQPEGGPLRHLAFVAIGASRQTRGGAEADELLAEGFGRD
jgi:plasmid stability protein